MHRLTYITTIGLGSLSLSNHLDVVADDFGNAALVFAYSVGEGSELEGGVIQYSHMAFAEYWA